MAQQNKDLLNRLMSRDFTAFAAGSVAMSPPVTRRTLSDYIALRKKAAGDEEKTEQTEAEGMGMSVVLETPLWLKNIDCLLACDCQDFTRRLS